MDNKEFRKHVECLMSMSTDFLMGGLKKETYLSNLGLLAGKMGARVPPHRCNCESCMEKEAAVLKRLNEAEGVLNERG